MILVTGGTGLLGSHLLFNLLEHGYDVKALVREDSDRNRILNTFSIYSSNGFELFNRIHWVIGDVTDKYALEAAFEQVDYVYHCAAYVSFSRRNRKKILNVNADGTANVVNACLAANIKKLCVVSSIATIVVPSEGFADEKLIWKPKKKASVYSLSKLKAELEVWRGITEGLNAVIVNPSVILGPGDWEKSSSAFFASVAKGLPFYPSGTTGFVDVRDVADVMIKLMESNISGERFILNSENISYQNFFTMVTKAVGTNHQSKPLINSLGRFISILDSMRAFFTNSEPKITMDTMRIAKKKLQYSNNKICDALNFKFRSVQNSIDDIAQQYKKQ